MNKEMLVIGNWKMNGLYKDSKDRVHNIVEFVKHTPITSEIVLCSPFTMLSQLCKDTAENNKVFVGGQDCHQKSSGAHTGDVSAEMLYDLGCKYVILGHSERRANYNESNELIKDKTTVAIETGLIPVLCIGDTLEEKEAGKTTEVLKEQLKGCLSDNSSGKNIVIAYEPIWSIGTGLIPTMETISHIAKEIRSFLSLLKGDDFSKEVKILYGGSVNPSNSQDIFAIQDINGGLIGGASLNHEEFCKIINTTK